MSEGEGGGGGPAAGLRRGLPADQRRFGPGLPSALQPSGGPGPLQTSASTSGIRVPPGSGLPGLRGRGRDGGVCVLHPGKPLAGLGLPRDTVK